MSHELDARQQAIDTLTSDNDKLNKSKKKVQSEVIVCLQSVFKPPPPVGAGGGYMFSGRPSVPLSVRASVRMSVIHVVVLCFRDISSIC